MTERKLESSLRTTISQYYDYLFARQLGVPATRIFADLPRSIVLEIKRSLCEHLLRNVPFFSLQSDSFITLCMERLDVFTYSPGMQIVQRGSLTTRQLVLIRSGKAEVRSNRQEEIQLATIVAGDFVGDFQLLFGAPHSNAVVCTALTEIAVLTYSSLAEVVNFLAKSNHCSRASVLSLESMEAHSHALKDRFPVSYDGIANTPKGYKDYEGSEEEEENEGIEEGEEYEKVPSNDEDLGLCSELDSKKPSSRMGVDAALVEDPLDHHMQGISGSSPSVYSDALISTLSAHVAMVEKLSKAQSTLDNLKTSRGNANKKLNKMLSMSGLPLETSQEVSKRVIMPNSPFVLFWELLIAIGIVYYTFATTTRLVQWYRCSFFTDSKAAACSQWEPSFAADYWFDLLFMLDTLLRSRFFAYRYYEGDREVGILGSFNSFNSFPPSFVFIYPKLFALILSS